MSQFNLLDHSITFQQPRRLTDIRSWQQHIPFAFALVDLLRPAVVVELGTHKGDSYCAFCQAVDTLALPAKCSAIDTWAGDEQAGLYCDEVLHELAGYHDPLYGRFSRLIQSTFDDALSRFEDGSIDLLHIDGLHTYEAVKHDFETWLPKVSKRGVVLFHDTNVREHDFGVWRLWEELQKRFSSREFKFGHGLGILAVGADCPPGLASLLTLDDRDWSTFEQFFCALGRQWQLGAIEKRTEELSRDLLEREEQISNLTGAVAERDVRLNEVGSQLHAVTVHRDAIVRSTSWRLTRPLRFVGNAAKFVIRPRGQRAITTCPAEPDKCASGADPEPGEPSQERSLCPKKSPFSSVENPKISIVIPTLNGGKYFQDLLQKLSRQVADCEYEIVVIDSGSTDGTIDAATKAGCKVLRVAPREFNHGATRNKAIEASSGEFVVLMTQDAEPANEFLLWWITRPFSDDTVAGVFARQSPRPDADPITKRNLNSWVTGRPQPERRSVASAEAFQALSPMDQLMLCTFDNVCSAIRRGVWLREPFSAMKFGEDIEWSKRVLTSGWAIAYEPHAHVIHSHDRSAIYEYKRNYMCHQTLYRLFRLQTVPTLRNACKSMVYGTLMDWRHVYREKMPLTKKSALMLRVPFMTVASVYGQYRGARDERCGQTKSVRGV